MSTPSSLFVLGLAVLGVGWWLASSGAPTVSDAIEVGAAAPSEGGAGGDPQALESVVPGSQSGTVVEPRAALEVAAATSPDAPGGASKPAASTSTAEKLPEHYVRVRVLTHAGAPATGVAVSLRAQHIRRKPRSLATAWADESGVAVLHSNDFTTLVTAQRGMLGRPALSVFADIPLTEEVIVSVPWPTQASDDVKKVHELTLPPLGSVTVHVIDPEGAPFLDPIWVGGRWVPTIEAETTSYGGYHRCQDYHRRTFGGATCYRFVGAGVSMSFTAQAPAYANGGVTDVPITVGPGANQDVTVQLGERRPRVRCRVLSADGDPVISETLEASVWRSPESGHKRPYSYPTSIQTDAEGVADFFFKWPPDAEYSRRLRLERLAGGSSSKPTADWSRAEVPLPSQLSNPLEHDLGTARLVAPELLQRGTVYDFNGDPASSVRLSFYSEVPGEAIEHSRDQPLGTAYSARDGGFEFRGFERPPGLRVALQGSLKIDGKRVRLYGEQRGLAVGDRSISLFLREPETSEPAPRGSVPVSAVFDEDLPGDYFAFQLLGGKRREEPLPMSAFRETPMPMMLEPGTWTFRAFLFGLDHDLLLIEGLEVVGNQTLNDPRCLPIDMRGLAQRVRFPVKRSNGAPWRGENLRVRVAVPPIDGRLRTGEDGYLDAAFPRGCSGVELSLDGEVWVPVNLDAMETVVLDED